MKSKNLNLLNRKRLAIAGGLLIIASGLLSIYIGVQEGFLHAQPDPAGLFGHVGVYSGALAIVIGGFLILIASREPKKPIWKIVFGLLTVILGHLGAITGALLVGTAGMLLSYITGIWLLIIGIRRWSRKS